MDGHAGRRRRRRKPSRPRRCWLRSAVIRSARTWGWKRSASKSIAALSRSTTPFGPRARASTRSATCASAAARAQSLGRRHRRGRNHGRRARARLRPVVDPGCIYCEPEVATVGLTEAQARERGLEVKVGKIPFRANGKAVAINQTEGFVKIVASKEYSEVIGCQIIGHHATDLISEVVLGRTLETTTAEIGHSAHPHPTLSESIMEAALAAEGEAINF